MKNQRNRATVALFGLIAVLILCGFTGCSSTPSTYQESAVKNEESVKSVTAGKEIPILDDSLDWDNLEMKYKFMNQKGRIGWVYIFSSTGVLISEEAVFNKMTSNNSYLTPMEEIKGSRSSPVVVQAPDLDGTYGSNPEGVFWFDPDSVYTELLPGGGIIIYSSERKQYDTPPLLKSHYKGD